MIKISIKNNNLTRSVLFLVALVGFVMIVQLSPLKVFATTTGTCTPAQYPGATYGYCKSYTNSSGVTSSYGCNAGFSPATNDMHPDNWDKGQWHYQMDVFVVDLEETSAQPDKLASDLTGLKVNSSDCGYTVLIGGAVQIDRGEMKLGDQNGQVAGDPTKPADMWLGAQAADVPNGFYTATISENCYNFNIPPVQCQTHDVSTNTYHNDLTVLMADYGYFQIGGGSAGTLGNHTVWCQNDTSIEAACGGDGQYWSFGGCPPAGPYCGSLGQSKGVMFTHTFCQMYCNDNRNFTWYTNYNGGRGIDGTDLGTYYTGKDLNGNLAPFTQHTELGAGKHSPANSEALGMRTYVQVRYPILTANLSASCTGGSPGSNGSISYSIQDPLANTYATDNPAPDFTFFDGSTTVDVISSGKSGTIDVPAVFGSNYSINITETVVLNGNVTKTAFQHLNCVSLTCTNPTSTIIGTFGSASAMAISISSNPSWIPYNFTLNYQYNGGSITTIVPLTTTGIYANSISQNITVSGTSTFKYWVTGASVASPGSIISAPSSANPCTITINTFHEPYLTVNGGDSVAGSLIGATGNCTDSSPDSSGDGILSYSSSTPSAGSGTTLAAQALGTISGFTTDTNGTINDLKFDSFGFAPCVSSSTSVPSNITPTDYIHTNTDTNNLNSKTSGSYTATSSTSTNYFSLGANTLPAGKQISIYVNGNVSINGNITYTTTGWTNIASIPNLRIVATGDIYISPDVTQLDGVYIAKGSIYDCSYTEQNSTTAIFGSLLNKGKYVNGTAPANSPCLIQLTVNGSLIAKTVNFQRTSGNINTGAPAETINYGPEDWLAPNIVNNGTVNAIQQLSPVL